MKPKPRQGSQLLAADPVAQDQILTSSIGQVIYSAGTLESSLNSLGSHLLICGFKRAAVSFSKYSTSFRNLHSSNHVILTMKTIVVLILCAASTALAQYVRPTCQN